MKILTKAAIAAATLSLLSGPAFADGTLGYVSPETVEAAAFGSTEMIVHIPQGDASRAITVAPVDVTNRQLVNAVPGTNQSLDMSGQDGSLRSCYTNGGIAKQDDSLRYYCAYDDSTGTVQASSPYITATGADTGYNGTNNVEDPALIDCVSRGGSLIQLAGNQQFACAM